VGRQNALFGKLWIEDWHGLAYVCNVGGVSFFLAEGRKNKINFQQICIVLSKG